MESCTSFSIQVLDWVLLYPVTWHSKVQLHELLGHCLTAGAALRLLLRKLP